MKKMAEMALAAAAEDFSSFGKKADIFFENNIINIDRFCEAGPAGIRFELGLGAKKRLTASCTDIDAFFGGVPILTGKGLFSPFFTEKMILFFREFLLPFFIR